MPLYFVQVVGDGPIKIGYSSNPLARLRSLETACPYELRLLAVAPGGKAEEAELHRTHAAARLRGEWFSPTPELLAVVREAAGASILPGSFEELCELDARLERLADDARAARRRMDRQPVACVTYVLERELEPRLHRLVGWGRRLEGEPLKARAAYEVAHGGLRGILGECRGCWCAVRVVA